MGATGRIGTLRIDYKHGASIRDEAPEAAVKAVTSGLCFPIEHRHIPRILQRSLFGPPRRELKSMLRSIGPGTLLFLFNFQSKTLHGVFLPVGRPNLNIVPEAWAKCSKRRFPAQLSVQLLQGSGAAMAVSKRPCKMRNIGGPCDAQKTLELLQLLGRQQAEYQLQRGQFL